MGNSVISDHFRKAQTIAEEIREKIVSGSYKAGERLPTRTVLTANYGVSNLTVQRALDRLRNDGFIVTEGRRGTFVANEPPHLTNYALLFPNQLKGDRTDNLWWHSIHVSALEWDEPGVVFSIYNGFVGREGFIDYDSLLDDIKHDRIAGLIFASPPSSLRGTPLLSTPGVPRVVLGSWKDESLVSISTDGPAFRQRALEYVIEQGCSRVAVLLTDKSSVSECGKYAELMQELGLRPRPRWLQSASLERREWAAQLIPLLFSEIDGERPDALIIADDNHAESATMALREMGLKSPDDLTIVSLCNFPLSLGEQLPVKALGFDQRLSLRYAIRAISDMRAGLKTEPHLSLPAIFDHELNES